VKILDSCFGLFERTKAQLLLLKRGVMLVQDEDKLVEF